ncbi:MAG: RIP metalloprotease RseP [Candidatus Moranbacteria bacterium]|nr:RIP metalloprotease RseP [Candidatus Moranbacteria bacterium]
MIIGTIILFILVLGILIFVHEMGHFITAKRNGVGAYEFGFGFPPRAIGIVKDDKTRKWRIVIGSKEHYTGKNTLYSLNWIPLGGFVRIKGEEGGHENEKDSFSAQSAWVRVKILAAGVVMNFVLAWVLISIVMFVGAPQPVDPGTMDKDDVHVQVQAMTPDAPGATMGLKVGDEIVKGCAEKKCQKISNVEDLQNFVAKNKGDEISLTITRGSIEETLTTTPRVYYPSDQGPLGVSLVEVSFISYPWYEAIARGAGAVINITLTILGALGALIASLFTKASVSADLAGPVGIAVLTRQVADLGFVYLMQFTAILSINLGIINILPIPALDGGRILFVLIEKIKGSPVSKKMEQRMHAAGFMLLIGLMLFVTVWDFLRFNIVEKIGNLF